jgi:hypothetical protein
LPKQGGGQLLPFRGSIDPCHPAAERMPARTAVRLQRHQTIPVRAIRYREGVMVRSKVTSRGNHATPARTDQTVRPKHDAEIVNQRVTAAGQRNSMLNNPKFANRVSFIEQLQQSAEAVRRVEDADPWESILRKVKGRVGQDGVERISTTDVFDELEVPMRRRPALTVRLSRLMHKHGWCNIRARGLNPGSYRDRVRGYAREVPGHPATVRLPNEC